MGLGFLGALSAAAVGVATARYGPGYSSDAVTYLATARNVAAGEGFYSHETLYVKWPPLFPILLAGIERVGIEAMAAARWINALAFGATVVAAGRLVRRAVRPGSCWTGWGALAVALASPLLVQAVKAQTEMLFVLLVMLFTRAAAHHMRAPGRRVTLALMALWAALACLQRYAGVWLIAAGVGLVVLRPWLMRRSAEVHWETVRKPAVRAVAFGSAAALPLAGWLLRNRFVAGSFLQRDVGEAEYTLGESLAAATDVLSGWALPPLVLPVPWRTTALVGAAALLGAVVWRLGRRPRRAGHAPAGSEVAGTRGAPAGRERRSVCWAVGVLAGLYMPFIVLSAAFEASSLPSRRLLMPAFPLMVVLTSAALDDAAARLSAAGRSRLRIAILVLAFAWLLYPMALSTAYVRVRAEMGGGGYNTTAWQASETARWLRTRPLPPGSVRSNDPHALYFLAGLSQHRFGKSATRKRDVHYLACFKDLNRARLHPQRLIDALLSLMPGISEGRVEASALPSPAPRPDCFDPSLTSPAARVTEVATLADGTVYRIE